ncbi:hypothetical protein MTR67_002457 [Solanum verrucosum]|uniref:Uncharacterized protein n=1 Tax=Solanum verrucosum TaxID=315347 RepID=A0AAF0PQL2_SOLVR|nr:hypothetical protein MTR67_002457 [Solanum verrucosum]
MMIRYSSSEQSNAMAGTPPLTQCFMNPDVSPLSTATPSATPDDTMPALAPGQKDILGRVMIEPDGSSIGTQISLRQYQNKPKRLGSRKGGSLHTGDVKTVGTIARKMEKELARTPIEPEVFKKTYVRKKENESDPNVWVEERAERTFSGLEGIGSSRQAETLDGVQIAAMSAQIAKLTAALAESERRKVAEQESMSDIV